MIDTIMTSPLVSAVLTMLGLGIACGALLGFVSIKFKVQGDPIAGKINALLPQTQCGQCGYPGCKPYAEAIVEGEAINRCAPGGDATIHELADLLGVDVLPLDAEDPNSTVPMYAYIREDECIGCTKCIQACPVDAILGAAQLMHTVIREVCTGCDLCVEPCPVDCIDMLPYQPTLQSWRWQLPQSEHNIIASDRAVSS